MMKDIFSDPNEIKKLVDHSDLRITLVNNISGLRSLLEDDNTKLDQKLELLTKIIEASKVGIVFANNENVKLK